MFRVVLERSASEGVRVLNVDSRLHKDDRRNASLSVFNLDACAGRVIPSQGSFCCFGGFRWMTTRIPCGASEQID